MYPPAYDPTGRPLPLRTITEVGPGDYVRIRREYYEKIVSMTSRMINKDGKRWQLWDVLTEYATPVHLPMVWGFLRDEEVIWKPRVGDDWNGTKPIDWKMRYPAVCCSCRQSIPRGTRGLWMRDTGVTCFQCENWWNIPYANVALLTKPEMTATKVVKRAHLGAPP